MFICVNVYSRICCARQSCKKKTVRQINIPVLWDVEWIFGVVVVASNLLHVENSQDPKEMKKHTINEKFGSIQRSKMMW